MYLFDLLFRLPPNVDVRVRFHGEKKDYHFRTGKRNTVKFVQEVSFGRGNDVKVESIYPLWHAEELYVECS